VIYTVHSKADPLFSIESLDGTRFVKEGFSWPAFFFSGVWLLFKRMWIVFFLFAAAQLALGIAADAIAAPRWFPLATGFLANLVLGLEGNALYRWTLARAGYEEEGMAAGDRVEDAEIRFFMR
jgi:Protein of unknown function (DUF2628)